MPKAGPTKDLKRAIADINQENDRAAAIVGGAFVENYLTLAVKSRLRPLSARFDDKLFAGYGPLASFSAKIDLGFALHLYNDPQRADLVAIKNVRNYFAHHIDVREFENEHVAKLCANMHAPERTTNELQGEEVTITRQRFTQTVVRLSIILSFQAMPPKPPEAPTIALY